MTDKEKLSAVRAKIEMRKETLKPHGGQGLVVTRLMRELCDDFLSFIDSMQEEPVSEDLEEAAKTYAKKESHGYEPCNIVETFKAGAKWQKQQIIAKAITAHCFGFQGDALFSFRLPARDYLVGSEVKTIVIKED